MKIIRPITVRTQRQSWVRKYRPTPQFWMGAVTIAASVACGVILAWRV